MMTVVEGRGNVHYYELDLHASTNSTALNLIRLEKSKYMVGAKNLHRIVTLVKINFTPMKKKKKFIVLYIIVFIVFIVIIAVVIFIHYYCYYI